MELEEAALGAAAASLTHEGAALTVSSGHSPSDSSRYAAAAGLRAGAWSCTLSRAEFRLLELFEQHRQGPVDDLGGVAAGNGMA
jgi:hypothetical protein